MTEKIIKDKELKQRTLSITANGVSANTDGIINPEAWFSLASSEIKYCWILKEPTRGSNSQGGVDQIAEKSDMLSLKEISGDMGYQTFLPMVALPSMVESALLPENTSLTGKEYSPSWAREEPAYKFFKSCTMYLNVKKIPTVENRSNREYRRWAKDPANLDLLSEQLSWASPKVIIFGGTADAFMLKETGKPFTLGNILETPNCSILNYTFNSTNLLKVNDNCFALYNSEVICISAYHPSNRTKRKEYLNNIITLICEYLKLRKP